MSDLKAVEALQYDFVLTDREKAFCEAGAESMETFAEFKAKIDLFLDCII